MNGRTRENRLERAGWLTTGCQTGRHFASHRRGARCVSPTFRPSFFHLAFSRLPEPPPRKKKKNLTPRRESARKNPAVRRIHRDDIAVTRAIPGIREDRRLVIARESRSDPNRISSLTSSTESARSESAEKDKEEKEKKREGGENESR